MPSSIQKRFWLASALLLVAVVALLAQSPFAAKAVPAGELVTCPQALYHFLG